MTEQVIEQGDVFDHIQSLEENSADCAVVDYPWEFDTQNGTGRYDDGDIFHMEGDDRVSPLLNELSRVLRPGSWLIFFADDRFVDVVRSGLRESDFTFRRNWAYSTDEFGMGYYGRINHWPVPVATLGDTDRYVTDRGTLFRQKARPECDYQTAKPVDLYRDLLASPVVRDNDRLLEPFCGSGPGAAVAVERGIDYWGCDVNPDAVKRTKERLQQTTVSDFSNLGAFGD